jgi:phage tail-like protein
MRRDDWLSHQLPVGMTDDDFLMRFLEIFQTVTDTVFHQIDTLPHMFDPAVAPDQMVRLMSRWLGLELVDSSLDDALQRQIVMEYSQLLKWRGTRWGMQHMLEVITDDEVTVEDSGGIYPEGEAPRAAPHVRIAVQSTGWATEEDLLVMVRTELPASVTFELRIGDKLVWPVAAPDLGRLAVSAGAVTPESVSVGAIMSATMSAATIGEIVGPGSMGPGLQVYDGEADDDVGTDARPEPHDLHRPDRLRDLDAPEHGDDIGRNADGTDPGGDR